MVRIENFLENTYYRFSAILGLLCHFNCFASVNRTVIWQFTTIISSVIAPVHFYMVVFMMSTHNFELPVYWLPISQQCRISFFIVLPHIYVIRVLPLDSVWPVATKFQQTVPDTCRYGKHYQNKSKKYNDKI